jgi:GTP-binding protein
MLIDRAEITVRGGHGGFAMPKKIKGKDGGNGGQGGSVYFKGSDNLNLLNQFSEKDTYIADNGKMGARGNKTGKDGVDLDIALPVGTSVYDKKTGELIHEILNVTDRFLIAKGGAGGFNRLVRISEGKNNSVVELAKQGEEKKLILSLRLIAEFGLIGLPNAGKSSLLNELTNAKAAIANYAFTTLEPNLGVFSAPQSGVNKTLADIPGLIEGASKGRGLGIAFLKHIEKVSVLLHCISCETTDVLKDYKTVRKELGDFKPELIDKPEIVLLTKTDMMEAKVVKTLASKLKKLVKTVLLVSIHDFKSLEELKDVLRKS